MYIHTYYIYIYIYIYIYKPNRIIKATVIKVFVKPENESCLK